MAKDGSLRIVALTGQCKDKETPLQWNTQGEQGPAGVLGFYTVQSEAVIPGFAEAFRTVEGTTARCNLGDKVTGGGHRYITYLADGSKVEEGFTDRLPLLANLPVAADPAQGLGEGWKVDVWSDSFSAILEVSAICADITP